MRYEYKVLPAPKAGLKGKGIKTAEDRFAHALATTMNILGAEGWEYQRTDTLPASQREGLMGKATVFQNMMVFRRALPDIVEDIPVPPLAIEADTSEDLAESNAEEDVADAPDAASDETITDDVAQSDDDAEEMSSGRRLNLNSESV